MTVAGSAGAGGTLSWVECSMAVKSTAVTVGTTPVAVADGTKATTMNPIGVILSVPTGGVTVYIGGPDVSVANGFPIAAGSQSPGVTLVNDILYAVVSAGTQAISVLVAGL